jgi:hypothetical protein
VKAKYKDKDDPPCWSWWTPPNHVIRAKTCKQSYFDMCHKLSKKKKKKKYKRVVYLAFFIR